MYSDVLGKKFKAWRTQFSMENGLQTVAQLPAVKAKQFETWLQVEISNAVDGDRRKALVDLQVAREASKVDGNIDVEFYKRFLAWLMGKGTAVDHAGTPWGRRPTALELEEVRELLEAFLWEVAQVENALLKLVLRGPQSLNDYYLYFKYILQHEQFVLEEDPWLFLDFKLYGGGAGTSRAGVGGNGDYHMGADGQPKLTPGTADLARLDAKVDAVSRHSIEQMQSFFQVFSEGSEAMLKKSEELQKALTVEREDRMRHAEYERPPEHFDDDGEAHAEQQPPEEQIVEQQKTMVKQQEEMVELLKQLAKKLEPSAAPASSEIETARQEAERVVEATKQEQAKRVFDPAVVPGMLGEGAASVEAQVTQRMEQGLTREEAEVAVARAQEFLQRSREGGLAEAQKLKFMTVPSEPVVEVPSTVTSEEVVETRQLQAADPAERRAREKRVATEMAEKFDVETLESKASAAQRQLDALAEEPGTANRRAELGRVVAQAKKALKIRRGKEKAASQPKGPGGKYTKAAPDLTRSPPIPE
jgi:hypothetical protein